MIEYANGTRASYSFNLFSVGYERSFVVYGTRGKLFGRDRATPLILEVDAPRYRNILWDFTTADQRGHGGGDLRLLRDFFDCIAQNRPSPFTTEVIIDSVAVALAIEDAWKTGTVIDMHTWRKAHGGM